MMFEHIFLAHKRPLLSEMKVRIKYGLKITTRFTSLRYTQFITGAGFSLECQDSFFQSFQILLNPSICFKFFLVP
jgi:hypothetical protein